MFSSSSAAFANPRIPSASFSVAIASSFIMYLPQHRDRTGGRFNWRTSHRFQFLGCPSRRSSLRAAFEARRHCTLASVYSKQETTPSVFVRRARKRASYPKRMNLTMMKRGITAATTPIFVNARKVAEVHGRKVLDEDNPYGDNQSLYSPFSLPLVSLLGSTSCKNLGAIVSLSHPASSRICPLFLKEAPITTVSEPCFL